MVEIELNENTGRSSPLLQEMEEDMEEDPPSPTMESPQDVPTHSRKSTAVVLCSATLLSALILIIAIGITDTWSSWYWWVPYLFLQIGITPVVAYFTCTRHGILRWFSGLVAIGVLSTYKSAILLPLVKGRMVRKALIYATTALWECSNCVLILAGQPLQKRYGLIAPTTSTTDTWHRCIIYASAPCQVKFDDHPLSEEPDAQPQMPQLINQVQHRDRIINRPLHSFGCVGLATIFMGVLGDLKQSPTVENLLQFKVFETEVLVWSSSLWILGLLNVPSHAWLLLLALIRCCLSCCLGNGMMLQDTTFVTAVLPYGCFCWSRSTREFWSKWSRPATSLIRHLIYHPLGGPSRWYLSIPIMFLLNASAHYDLSESVNADGDRCETYWNIIFAVLALAAMMEVGGDKLMQNYGFCRVLEQGNVSEYPRVTVGGVLESEITIEDIPSLACCDTVEYPRWYRFLRAGLAHASLRIALYVMVHYCFKTSLDEILDRFKTALDEILDDQE